MSKVGSLAHDASPPAPATAPLPARVPSPPRRPKELGEAAPPKPSARARVAVTGSAPAPATVPAQALAPRASGHASPSRVSVEPHAMVRGIHDGNNVLARATSQAGVQVHYHVNDNASVYGVAEHSRSEVYQFVYPASGHMDVARVGVGGRYVVGPREWPLRPYVAGDVGPGLVRSNYAVPATGTPEGEAYKVRGTTVNGVWSAEAGVMVPIGEGALKVGVGLTQATDHHAPICTYRAGRAPECAARRPNGTVVRQEIETRVYDARVGASFSVPVSSWLDRLFGHKLEK